MKDNQIKNIKSNYPAGTRVVLDSMGDDPNPIPNGTVGTVDFADDTGTLHTSFDNGRRLGICPDADYFHKISTLKFYSPIQIEICEFDENGEISDFSGEMRGEEISEYETDLNDRIAEIVKNERIMFQDIENRENICSKIYSLKYAFESVDSGKVYFTIECEVRKPLNEAETEDLREFIKINNADGIGQKIESEPIVIPEIGELAVSVGSSGDDYFVLTEAEFSEHQQELFAELGGIKMS